MGHIQNLSTEPGTVYWITGLSGAGKTTIGTLLYEKVKSQKDNVVFLDGDALGNGAGKIIRIIRRYTLKRHWTCLNNGIKKGCTRAMQTSLWDLALEWRNR